MRTRRASCCVWERRIVVAEIKRVHCACTVQYTSAHMHVCCGPGHTTVRASFCDSHNRIGLFGFFGAGVRAKRPPTQHFFTLKKRALIFLLYCDLHGARKTMSCFIRSELGADTEKQF